MGLMLTIAILAVGTLSSAELHRQQLADWFPAVEGEVPPAAVEAATAAVRATMGDSIFASSVELAGATRYTQGKYRVAFQFKPEKWPDHPLDFEVLVNSDFAVPDMVPALRLLNRTPHCAQNLGWCEIEVSAGEALEIAAEAGLSAHGGEPFVELGVKWYPPKLVWRVIKVFDEAQDGILAVEYEVDPVTGECEFGSTMSHTN